MRIRFLHNIKARFHSAQPSSDVFAQRRMPELILWNDPEPRRYYGGIIRQSKQQHRVKLRRRTDAIVRNQLDYCGSTARPASTCLIITGSIQHGQPRKPSPPWNWPNQVLMPTIAVTRVSLPAAGALCETAINCRSQRAGAPLVLRNATTRSCGDRQAFPPTAAVFGCASGFRTWRTISLRPRLQA